VVPDRMSADTPTSDRAPHRTAVFGIIPAYAGNGVVLRPCLRCDRGSPPRTRGTAPCRRSTTRILSSLVGLGSGSRPRV